MRRYCQSSRWAPALNRETSSARLPATWVSRAPMSAWSFSSATSARSDSAPSGFVQKAPEEPPPLAGDLPGIAGA